MPLLLLLRPFFAQTFSPSTSLAIEPINHTQVHCVCMDTHKKSA